MGHKKRNVPPRSKPSPAVVEEGSVVPHGVLSTIETTERNFNFDSNHNTSIEPHKRPNNQTKAVVDAAASSFSELKLECQKALAVSRRGSHNKALRMMKDLRNKYDSSVYSGLIHRVEGYVWLKYASVIDDGNTKHRYLKSALESARKAVLLSPDSIEFAYFYASLLYDASNSAEEYDEVVQECKKALSIENPVDPGKENFLDESILKLSTPDVRICNMQNDLRDLIQKANITSLSTWMKNLGTVDQNFRVIPVRRISEDPMEVRLVQAKRPNEIKKATKTPEERRKEIEVQVAAARLLQQNSVSPQPRPQPQPQPQPQLQKAGDKSAFSISGSSQRGSERRRPGNMRRSSFSAKKRNLVMSYWNSMTLNMKKDLLRIKIPQLMSHFSLGKENLAISVFLREAISFAEINKTWNFWMCCRCGEKFPNPGSHLQHLKQEHMGNVSLKLQSMIPLKLSTEWIDMLLGCSWKPIDAKAAVTLLENQSQPQVAEHLVESYSLNKTEEYKDCLSDPYCSEDSWDSPSQTADEERCNWEAPDSNIYYYGPDIASRECDENHGRKLFLTTRWPLSGDSECEKLLDKIRSNFEVLIRNKCLAASHVDKVIQYAVDELQGLAFGSQLINYGVEQTPVCICFLGSCRLKQVLNYLQELSQFCGITERNSDLDNAIEKDEMTARLVLSEDVSTLLLDKHFLSSNLMISSQQHPPLSDARFEYSFLLGSHYFVNWISYGPFPGEQIDFLKRMAEDKAHQGTEIVQKLETEFYHLQSLYERKCEHLGYNEALQAVKDLCLEEGKRREHGTELIHQSYESFLRKRREELIESDSNVVFIVNRFELDAISNVLKDAEALSINQFGFEETYGVSNHLLPDLESGEDADWMIKDYLQQVDSCIEVAIQRQKDRLATEISKLDARIMRCLSEMEQMDARITSVSAFDYHPTLLSIVKAFLKATLEDLAEKDATEKSNAAREAFLAELALDKMVTVGGNGDTKYGHEKTRDKKKHKEHKKTKDLKDTGNNEATLHQETAEQNSWCSSFSVVSDEDDYENGNFAPESCNDSVENEEERRRIELEEDERKLEETLEYQRRVEDEAKQKHLAEKHRKMAGTIPGKLDDIYQVNRQKYIKQEQLHRENGYTNIVEGMHLNVVPKVSNTQDHQSMEVKRGLPNGGIPEDVNLSAHCDQWVERRGRRRKSSSKFLNEKSQNVSAEKENINVGDVGSKNSLPDGHQVGEDETKTLRQLHSEDDDKRFEADLERAVRQSLDTFHARQNFPLVSSSKMYPKMTSELDFTDSSFIEVELETATCGTGLKNEVGEYNCFLNVIIQSLWHLRRFRDEFLKRSASDHFHIGDPCVTCALYSIFSALSMASKKSRNDAVAPTALRIALSNLYPDSNFFQEAQMNDASEVLGVIFDCLHRSFASRSGVSETKSDESSCPGLWDCSNAACIAHTLFGMDIFEKMNCYNCGLESRHLKYTSFFHNINASALRTMKVTSAESSFDEILNFVERNHQLTCDSEAGGCGKLNYIHHILSTAPHVFTTVLGWQNTCESVEDIKATLEALDTEIDVGVLYRGIDPESKYHLVSVVCYYGQHYDCFAYSRDHERWMMYDDKTVKVIGEWADVVTMCERGHLQPQVLFYEAAAN